MLYKKAKVYYDGSHYIAIPRTTQPWKKRKLNKPIVKKEITNENEEIDCKVVFEKLYKDNLKLSKREKIIAIEKEFKKILPTNKAKEIVKENFDRKQRNMVSRRIRLCRKAYLQEWDYFCTFTYDSNKLTEDEFRKKFSNCLRHLAYRKGWKYIGVYERSPENNRLHFHGLFQTPNMVGEMIETKDYSTKKHEMQTTHQNGYFLKRFGRNDFEAIDNYELRYSIQYLLKYIEKSGEKIVYSKGLGTYFVSDIIENDIVCPIGQEDRKRLLFDNFHCLVEGEVIGQVSSEVIDKMPKEN